MRRKMTPRAHLGLLTPPPAPLPDSPTNRLRTAQNKTGFEARVPTAHSVLLAALLGPLGAVAHLLTQLAYAAASAALGRDVRPRGRAVRAAGGGGGVITLLPYEGEERR